MVMLMKYPAIFAICLFSLHTTLSVADTTTAKPTATTPPAAASATAKPLADADKLLAQLVDGGIRPLYRELDVSANTLMQRSQTFCGTPNAENFKILRQGWGETLLAWQRTDALLFGPAVENQIDFQINFNPPKKIIINQLLNATTALDVAAVEAAGVGGQGLGTLEFLLFDRDKTNTQLLELFQGNAGKRRCAYVQAASELLRKNIQIIADQWLKDDSNTYATQFRNAHKGNVTFSSAQQAIDLLVSKLYQSAERSAKNRIGNPLGKGIDLNTEGKQEVLNTSNAYQLENWRSGYAIKSVRANMDGMMRILRDGGVLEWLRTHNSTKVEAVVADTTESRLRNYLLLPEPSADPFELIQSGKTKELDGYYYLGNDIQMGIKRQLAKVLGTQLGFNDNDGD